MDSLRLSLTELLASGRLASSFLRASNHGSSSSSRKQRNPSTSAVNGSSLSSSSSGSRASVSAHHCLRVLAQRRYRRLVGVVAARVEQVESSAGHGFVHLHVADGVFQCRLPWRGRFRRRPQIRRQRLYARPPSSRCAAIAKAHRQARAGLGPAQAALAPQDAGQFLNQMLLGRSLRGMLGGERCAQY
jgi:hypothetical protein